MCGFYEQMCRPAASGLNPWKYGRRGQQDIFSDVKIQSVSKRVEEEKSKKPDASVFVSTPFLKHGISVSQKRTKSILRRYKGERKFHIFVEFLFRRRP